MEKIITLDDLVARDQKESVQAWILAMCADAVKSHKIDQGWDGVSIEGEPVLAFVNNGRWLGRCKVCGNPIYVSPLTPVLYCPECGNGGSTSAWSVEFPVDREAIEKALIARPVELMDPKGLIRNDVERALKSRPSIPALPRSWRPGITVAMLEEEKVKAMEKRR